MRVKGRREPNRAGVASGAGSGWRSESSVAGSAAARERGRGTNTHLMRVGHGGGRRFGWVIARILHGERVELI